MMATAERAGVGQGGELARNWVDGEWPLSSETAGSDD